MHPTAHPKVFTANLRNTPQSGEMDALLERGVAHPELALSLLCEMVPEYTPDPTHAH